MRRIGCSTRRSSVLSVGSPDNPTEQGETMVFLIVVAILCVPVVLFALDLFRPDNPKERR